jgi:hypothetical protein
MRSAMAAFLSRCRVGAMLVQVSHYPACVVPLHRDDKILCNFSQITIPSRSKSSFSMSRKLNENRNLGATAQLMIPARKALAWK